VLRLRPGFSAVRQLEFKIRAKDIHKHCAPQVLEMLFDGEQTVWCPVGDLFGNVNAITPYRMWNARCGRWSNDLPLDSCRTSRAES